MNDALRKKLTEQQGQVIELEQSIFKDMEADFNKALDEKNGAKVSYYEAFRHGVKCMTELILDAITEEKLKKGREQ